MPTRALAPRGEDGRVSNDWFPDGTTNLCRNALDRHVDAGQGERVALAYHSAVGGASREISYRELRDDVASFAGALRELGVEARRRTGTLARDSSPCRVTAAQLLRSTLSLSSAQAVERTDRVGVGWFPLRARLVSRRTTRIARPRRCAPPPSKNDRCLGTLKTGFLLSCLAARCGRPRAPEGPSPHRLRERGSFLFGPASGMAHCPCCVCWPRRVTACCSTCR